MCTVCKENQSILDYDGIEVCKRCDWWFRRLKHFNPKRSIEDTLLVCCRQWDLGIMQTAMARLLAEFKWEAKLKAEGII